MNGSNNRGKKKRMSQQKDFIRKNNEKISGMNEHRGKKEAAKYRLLWTSFHISMDFSFQLGIFNIPTKRILCVLKLTSLIYIIAYHLVLAMEMIFFVFVSIASSVTQLFY